jgi:L-alanine-DL-glutamate epimerase-like enolase superfamily enzyme
MGKKTDIYPGDASLYFLPVETRVPLKFGTETLTHVTCARVCMRVKNAEGHAAEGWGETPLSVQWVWPSSLPYEDRHKALKDFCIKLSGAWADFEASGHPMEIGYEFQQSQLTRLLAEFNQERPDAEPMPWLAALVCCSAFDIALHDAYGMLHQVPVYDTYNAEFMNVDLSYFITPAEETDVSFSGKYPADFLVSPRPDQIPAWHLVGGKDLIDKSELNGTEPDDGYPVLLPDWIQRDGLNCLKVKLRGVVEYPRVYGMILYVEQPFPYDLEENQIDVHSVSARKPLFMDESAHDWHLIKLGRKLGWTGVALKTCKTQTGALLSLCWAKAHGMTLMVQDLTNPMIAQVPHVLLAAYAGTIMGVETNSMQFYPEASLPEAAVHPGIYQRRNGVVDLSTIQGSGFGYRLGEIKRKLPASV